MLKDPKMEARARELSRELRCMVCQNQSIDESEAPLARDLRLLVRERLTKGDSDQQVLDFLVSATVNSCCSSRRSNGTRSFCGRCRRRRSLPVYWLVYQAVRRRRPVGFGACRT